MLSPKSGPTELSLGLKASCWAGLGLVPGPTQLRVAWVVVPGSGSGENFSRLVGSSGVKFEPGGPALDSKSDPEGPLPGMNASCWGHARLNSSSLMLNGYTAGLDAGLINE